MICSKNSNSYSISTVVILLISSGFKILFYFFFHYSIIILGQSIFQFALALLMAFLKYHFEEPLVNFPFISPNIYLSFSNRIRLLSLPYILRLFNISKAKSFIEFIFSILLYIFLIFNIFLILYLFVSLTVTIYIAEYTASLVGSFVLFPTFAEILKKEDIDRIPFLIILKFLFIDVSELLILIYYESPISFIIGIAIQLFFNTIFFCIFSIKKCLHKPNKYDNTNLVYSASASETNSVQSNLKSNSNSDNSQKEMQSDKSSDAEKKYQLQMDDCVLQPLNKIEENNFSGIKNECFDFKYYEKNEQNDIGEKDDLISDEINDKSRQYLC